MKRNFLTILLLATLFFTTMINHPVVSDPTDTVADATIIDLNTRYTETMVQYNDKHYFNFSGSPFEIYNFTMWQNASNYLPIYLYDNNGNLLKNNFSSPYDQKYIIYQGKSDYTFAVFSSEFAVFPAAFNITVTIAQGEPGQSPTSSKPATLGSQSDTFTEGSQSIWYTFQGDPLKTYNMTMSLSVGNYSSFEIYDSSLNQLESKYDSSGYHTFKVTGHDEYHLRPVSDFEFIVLPQDFTITIQEVIENTSSDQDDTTNNETPTDNSGNALTNPLRFNSYLLPLNLLVITLIITKKRSRKDE